MKAKPQQLDYASPANYEWDWTPLASLAAGCTSLLLDLLWWEGAFASWSWELMAFMASLTLGLSAAGFLFGLWGLRHWLGWVGLLTCIAGGGTFIRLFVYALGHLMPNC